MLKTTIDVKFKIGDVIEIKENSPTEIPAGVYVVYLIATTSSASDKGVVTKNEYFLENTNSQDRDWSLYDDEISENDDSIKLLDKKADLYKVTYRDVEDNEYLDDLVYVPSDIPVDKAYLEKRVEITRYDADDRGVIKHTANVLAWELVGEKL